MTLDTNAASEKIKAWLRAKAEWLITSALLALLATAYDTWRTVGQIQQWRQETLPTIIEGIQKEIARIDQERINDQFDDIVQPRTERLKFWVNQLQAHNQMELTTW